MTTTMQAPKDQLVKLAQQQMLTALADNTYTARQKLALTCRILFDGGHDSGLAGQITARAQEPGTYYTQQLGLGFDEIAASNLLVVDEDLTVLQGRGMANPANRFHSWLYRARPDVNCIIHTTRCTAPPCRCWKCHWPSRTWTCARCSTTAPSSRNGPACRSATKKAKSSRRQLATNAPSCFPTTAC